MTKNTVLEVLNLKKNFGKTKAVDEISFNVRQGEIVGLLGPNGAGKTTTIMMLLGVLTPSSGTIKYFGKDFKLHREEILRQINFCSSYIRFPWRMTVLENLDVAARLYEIEDRSLRIEKFLQVFEMSEYKNKSIASLSAGQIMRVMLAKAFLNHPKLLLLDEPTASLDPDVAKKVREFLIRQQREFKVTMLLTSHNMAEVEELCDRVIFLNEGKILKEDTPEGLAEEIEISRVDLLIDKNIEKAQELCAQYGWSTGVDRRYLKVELSEKEISKLLMTLGEAGIKFKEISIDKPDLEDFFIKAAKKELT